MGWMPSWNRLHTESIQHLWLLLPFLEGRTEYHTGGLDCFKALPWLQWELAWDTIHCLSILDFRTQMPVVCKIPGSGILPYPEESQIKLSSPSFPDLNLVDCLDNSSSALQKLKQSKKFTNWSWYKNPASISWNFSLIFWLSSLFF